jgi:hypothetical protein
MTEEEALDRVDEIGQAFANDFNDGEDDSPDFDGLHTYYNREGDLHLVYSATFLNDGEENTTKVVWRMELVSLDES